MEVADHVNVSSGHSLTCKHSAHDAEQRNRNLHQRRLHCQSRLAGDSRRHELLTDQSPPVVHKGGKNWKQQADAAVKQVQGEEGRYRFKAKVSLMCNSIKARLKQICGIAATATQPLDKRRKQHIKPNLSGSQRISAYDAGISISEPVETGIDALSGDFMEQLRAYSQRCELCLMGRGRGAKLPSHVAMRRQNPT